MPETVIQSEPGHQIVLERIAELAGCLEGTPEEQELIEMLLVVEVWENKRWTGAVALSTACPNRSVHQA